MEENAKRESNLSATEEYKFIFIETWKKEFDQYEKRNSK